MVSGKRQRYRSFCGISPDNKLDSLTVEQDCLMCVGFGSHLGADQMGRMQLANRFWSAVAHSVRAFVVMICQDLIKYI